MGRRSVLLVSGVLVAALGTMLVFLYANNVKQTSYENTEVVAAYVASVPISVGTPGAEAATQIEATELPAGVVPAGAIIDPAEISEGLAVVPVQPGQVILASMFGDASAVESLPIPEGKMGVAVQLDDAQRVAGFVIPGSEVAVFSTVDGDAEAGGTTTRLLLPRATVAAVGPTTIVSRTTGEGEAVNVEEIPTAILTLALDQVDAERLIFGQQQTTLHFALLTPQSASAPSAGINSGSLFAQ